MAEIVDHGGAAARALRRAVPATQRAGVGGGQVHEVLVGTRSAHLVARLGHGSVGLGGGMQQDLRAAKGEGAGQLEEVHVVLDNRREPPVRRVEHREEGVFAIPPDVLRVHVRRANVGDQPFDVVLVALAVTQLHRAGWAGDEARGEPHLGPVRVPFEGGSRHVDFVLPRERPEDVGLGPGNLDADRLPVIGRPLVVEPLKPRLREHHDARLVPDHRRLGDIQPAPEVAGDDVVPAGRVVDDLDGRLDTGDLELLRHGQARARFCCSDGAAGSYPSGGA